MKYKKFDKFDELIDVTVDKLVENEFVMWFQGKSEFGPRALGNRSILANPCYSNIEKLNSEIKYREYWRPYAPIMLEEDLHDWFDIPLNSSPYMLFNAHVKFEQIGKIPSVTHVDNSSRVQTVTPALNEKMYKLLKEFKEKTDVPILLNTSFNINNEPIVETPMDAINTFVNSKVKFLVIGNIVLRK